MALAGSFYARHRRQTTRAGGAGSTPSMRVTKTRTTAKPAGSFLGITDGFRPGTGAPAGTPAVGALPGPEKPKAGPPIDPIYDAQVGAAQKTRSDKIAGLGQQRIAGLSDFGYTETGGVLAFDPNNPFSQAALLKRNYDNARRGNVTSLAARGQLYAGSLQNAQANTNFGQGADNNGLQKRLLAFLAGNTSGVQTAGNDYDTSVAGYAGERVARATR